MSIKYDSAFPDEGNDDYGEGRGLTKLEYAAIHILAGSVSNSSAVVPKRAAVQALEKAKALFELIERGIER